MCLLETYYVQSMQSNMEHASMWSYWKEQFKGDENPIRHLYCRK